MISYLNSRERKAEMRMLPVRIQPMIVLRRQASVRSSSSAPIIMTRFMAVDIGIVIP